MKVNELSMQEGEFLTLVSQLHKRKRSEENDQEAVDDNRMSFPVKTTCEKTSFNQKQEQNEGVDTSLEHRNESKGCEEKAKPLKMPTVR